MPGKHNHNATRKVVLAIIITCPSEARTMARPSKANQHDKLNEKE